MSSTTKPLIIVHRTLWSTWDNKWFWLYSPLDFLQVIRNASKILPQCALTLIIFNLTALFFFCNLLKKCYPFSLWSTVLCSCAIISSANDSCIPCLDFTQTNIQTRIQFCYFFSFCKFLLFVGETKKNRGLLSHCFFY